MPINQPFLTGRLACWKQVGNRIVRTQQTKDVRFATLDQIADHMDQLQLDAIWHSCVETLTYHDGPIPGDET